MTQAPNQNLEAKSIVESDDATLRSDVRRLGDLLGQSLVRQEGQQLLDLVESVRKSVREGSGIEILDKLTVDESVQLVRAFSTYFHLANVAEQVHRSRVLAEVRERGGSWITRAIDKIESAINNPVSGHEITQQDLTKWINDLNIRPVFTAHPTEAARRSILGKLGEIASLLDTPKSVTQDERLAETVDLLWQTDELRLDRPEPLDEAMNALYYTNMKIDNWDQADTTGLTEFCKAVDWWRENKNWDVLSSDIFSRIEDALGDESFLYSRLSDFNQDELLECFHDFWAGQFDLDIFLENSDEEISEDEHANIRNFLDSNRMLVDFKYSSMRFHKDA